MGSFDNDLLGRKKYAEFLLTLIQNYERYKRNNESKSFVMAIDSPWGTGKSHFVNMFESFLNEKNKGNSYTVIRYNAWESDFWNNAFDPLMYVMLKDNRVNDGIGSKDFWEEFKKCIYAVGKGIALQPLMLAAGENATKQIEKSIDTVLEMKSIVRDYEDFHENLLKLKTMICKYKDFLVKIKPDMKLVIILDELDRCKPIFAVQTLEIVKHIFDVENVVFMFALDIQQLSSSAKSVYGSEMDSIGYLTRFFDYISKIPEGETSQYADFLCKRRLSKYIDTNSLSGIIAYFKVLTNKCLLSLRDMETIYTNFILLVDYDLKKQPIEVYRFYLWAILLKYKDPFIFSQFVSGRLNLNNSITPAIIKVTPVSYESLLKVIGQELVNIRIITKPLNLIPFMNLGFKQIEWNNLKVVGIAGDEIRYGIGYNDSQDVIYISQINGNNINNIVTADDIRRWGEINTLTLGHYLQRKLELFDFRYASTNYLDTELEDAPL